MIDKSQAVASLAPQPANLVVATGISNCRWTITNNTDAPLKLYWIDFDGKEVPYGEIAPGSSLSQNQTYSTHVWEVKNATVFVCSMN